MNASISILSTPASLKFTSELSGYLELFPDYEKVFFSNNGVEGWTLSPHSLARIALARFGDTDLAEALFDHFDELRRGDYESLLAQLAASKANGE